MFFLGARGKILTTVSVGVVGFGVVAAALASVSAQASSGAVPSPTVSSSSFPTPTPGPTAVPELAIGPVTAIASGSEIALPIDSHKVSPATEDLVLKAEYKAMKDCMSRYGIGFDAPAASWTAPTVNHDYDRLFGLIDMTEAQKFGYHTGGQLLPSGESVSSSASATSSVESAPDYLAVAMGDPAVSTVNGSAVPKGGCIGEARSKVGDTQLAQELYEGAVNYGLSQSDLDRRVNSAFKAWSVCMSKAGFTYATPMDAINDPHWGTSSQSASEVKVAMADVNCKVAVNLTGLRVAVAAAWQSQYITDHAAQFVASASDLEQQVAKANAILQ